MLGLTLGDVPRAQADFKLSPSGKCPHSGISFRQGGISFDASEAHLPFCPYATLWSRYSLDIWAFWICTHTNLARSFYLRLVRLYTLISPEYIIVLDTHVIFLTYQLLSSSVHTGRVGMVMESLNRVYNTRLGCWLRKVKLIQ